MPSISDIFTCGNADLSLSFSTAGKLLSLRSLATGTEHVAQASELWRLIVDDGETRARVITPDKQDAMVVAESERITVCYQQLRSEGEVLNIGLSVSCELWGGESRWQIVITSREPAIRIMEVWGPILSGLRPAAEWALYFPQDAGLRLRDPLNNLGSRDAIQRFGTKDTKLRELYPGKASMQWMGLYSEAEGIYYGIEDQQLHTICLHVERVLEERAEEDSLLLAAIHYPGLREGCWTSPPVVIAAHQGDWHTGARRYRAWTDSWLTPPTPPEWISRLPGLQDTILREQFGAWNYRYADLPALHEAAAEVGMDTIKITGWHRAGHDNGYPDYDPDPAQGGADALAAAIRQVREAGGRVMLYLQAVQMTANSSWYQQHGEQASLRDPFGNALADTFTWPGGSSYLPLCAQQRLIVACPSDAEWQRQILALVEQALALSPDSIYLDRMAGYPGYLCFAETHGHRNPNESVAARLELAMRCRALIKSRDPEIAVGSEYINDAGLQAFDFTIPFGHGMHYGGTNFGELFRYTFPEYVITTQYLNSAEYDRVCYALVMGYRLFFAIRWQHAPISETPPAFRAFVKQVITLLTSYADPFLTGRFCDEEGLCIGNTALVAKRYAGTTQDGVAVWNPTEIPQPLTITLRDGQALHWIGLDGPLADELPAHGIAVAVYHRENFNAPAHYDQ